jgi:hypothetical protein
VGGDDAPVRVPLALRLAEAIAYLGRQDRVDLAGPFGEVEVAAVGGPGAHRLLDLAQVGGDRLAQLRRHRHADAVHGEAGVQVREGAAVLGGPPKSATKLAQLAEQ